MVKELVRLNISKAENQSKAHFIENIIFSNIHWSRVERHWMLLNVAVEN